MKNYSKFFRHLLNRIFFMHSAGYSMNHGPGLDSVSISRLKVTLSFDITIFLTFDLAFILFRTPDYFLLEITC